MAREFRIADGSSKSWRQWVRRHAPQNAFSTDDSSPKPNDRGRDKVGFAPPSEPDRRYLRIRLSS
jgi:hypothetical protein